MGRAGCVKYQSLEVVSISGASTDISIDEGYWVPYVVALHYVRHWSFDYRHLFVVIWGNFFPGTCKRLGERGYRVNTLEPAVVAAARRESTFFFNKAVADVREPLQSSRKKTPRGSIPGTRIAPAAILERRDQQSSSMQHLVLSSSPSGRPLPPAGRLQHTSSLTAIHNTKHAHDLLPSHSTAYYDPVREMRTHRFADQRVEPLPNPSIDWNSRYPYTYGGEQQSGSVPKVISRRMSKGSEDPYEWGKRKRGPDEAPSRSPRKKHEERWSARGEAVLYERQTDRKYFIGSDGKVHDIWISDERNPRGYEAEKGWQRQEEQEAAAALMLLSGDEAALVGRAAITA